MNRNFVLIATSLFLWGIGEGLFIYFQPLYLQEMGADSIMIGGILGATGIVMALAQIPAGLISDRFGAQPVMVTAWMIGTLAVWIMAISKSLPSFVVGLLLYGISGFSIAPMNSYLSSVRGRLSVSQALTIPNAMYHLGAVLGPITGGQIADRMGFRTIYLFSGVIFVFSTALVFFIEKNPPVHHEDQQSISHSGAYKNPAFLGFVAITFLTMAALYLPQPLTPNFLQNQQGYTSSRIGLLGTFGSLGNAIITLTLGSLNPMRGLVIGQILMSFSTILFFKGNTPALFGLGYFFFGGYRLCRSMVLAFARPLVHPSETGMAFGILETANAVAVIIAPVLAGVLFAKSPTLPYLTAMISLIPVILATWFGLPVIQKISKQKMQEGEGVIQP